MNAKTIGIWALRLIPAIIFLQTLFFKFTGAPEPIFIFDTLGVGDFGRYGTGIMELISAILLLIPSKTWMGAVLGVGIMAGAILSHLTVLGIEVMGDGGLLFMMGVVAFICCAILVWINRQEVPVLKNFA